MAIFVSLKIKEVSNRHHVWVYYSLERSPCGGSSGQDGEKIMKETFYLFLYNIQIAYSIQWSFILTTSKILRFSQQHCIHIYFSLEIFFHRN